VKFAVIVSLKDIAGLNIKDKLLKSGFQEAGQFRGEITYSAEFKGAHVSLLTVQTDTIVTEGLDAEVDADIMIFATRHQSRSEEKTLSVHIPGNYGKAEYGGYDGELCMSAPVIMKKAFQLLHRHAVEGYAISLESTHHGPLLKTPVFFIEIGSTEGEWNDPVAGKAIADTLIELFRSAGSSDDKVKTAIGFGGTHYCSAFNRIELETDVAMSHICPKYAMDKIDKEMVRKMISATGSKVDMALLDWNGLSGEEKTRLKDIFLQLGLDCRKTKEII
jgi:D-aminoacyl-tRNA deacylase